jgi:hypothetical protein
MAAQALVMCCTSSSRGTGGPGGIRISTYDTPVASVATATLSVKIMIEQS